MANQAPGPATPQLPMFEVKTTAVPTASVRRHEQNPSMLRAMRAR